MSDRILIGGQALVQYGSSRGTRDTDYLVYDESAELFVHDEAGHIDYINAAKSPFLADIWATEQGREIASPQALLELKSWALINHCQNGYWQKADDAEYDMKFLCRTFGLRDAPVLARYAAAGEMQEIRKIIDSVR